MKPLLVFEMDLWHAKRCIKNAIQDILDHKKELGFDDAQQLSWQLNNALGWLDSVENYYLKRQITEESNDETDGH